MPKYHNKIGIYAAFFLALIALTGMFVRPPLLIAIASKSVPSSCYPASDLENPWKGKIRNAVYNSIDKTLIVATNDGFFQGPADFSMPFKKINSKEDDMAPRYRVTLTKEERKDFIDLIEDGQETLAARRKTHGITFEIEERVYVYADYARGPNLFAN